MVGPHRRLRAGALVWALLFAALLGGCVAPGGTTTAAPDTVTEDRDDGGAVGRWDVVDIVDGDTIDVRSRDGVAERVRIIGIDTPERGVCGFGEASVALADLLVGRRVTLVAGAVDDRDRYGRLLRYVDVGETDAGLELLRRGLAVARYDSRDGYGAHPREAAYVAADAAIPDIACTDG